MRCKTYLLGSVGGYNSVANLKLTHYFFSTLIDVSDVDLVEKNDVLICYVLKNYIQTTNSAKLLGTNFVSNTYNETFNLHSNSISSI